MRIALSTPVLPVTQYRSRSRFREDEMKLEPDLLRELLLYVEENATRVHSDLDLIHLDGWDDDQVTYHVLKAAEAGLLEVTSHRLSDDSDPDIIHIAYSVHSLHYKGHELLGAIREPKHWKLIRDGTKQAGLATVGSIFSFAEAYVKMKAAQYLGISPD